MRTLQKMVTIRVQLFLVAIQGQRWAESNRGSRDTFQRLEIQIGAAATMHLTRMRHARYWTSARILSNYLKTGPSTQMVIVLCIVKAAHTSMVSNLPIHLVVLNASRLRYSSWWIWPSWCTRLCWLSQNPPCLPMEHLLPISTSTGALSYCWSRAPSSFWYRMSLL